jgi:DNA-directed RNA polymerase subunit RPC12/RpoP
MSDSYQKTTLDAIHSEFIQNVRNEISTVGSSIESSDKVLDYYLKTGNILYNYYDIQDKIAKGNTETLSIKKRPGTIFEALEIASRASDPDAAPEPNKKTKIPSAQIGTPIKNREKLLDEYLQIINPEMAKVVVDEIQDTFGECNYCGNEMILSTNEAYLACTECGHQDPILIDSDKPSYKDPPREVSYYAYKRINHFNEWLAQFQAKESTEIPHEVYDAILVELKKERIVNMNALKQTKLREILKKLKLNKYYEHTAHILNRLNGQNAPVMSRDNEEKLRYMFKEIQPSFQAHRPKDRSNFLHYPYVLYKFCELLELDEFLPCFPLLKNRDKLYAHDKIWQKICLDMNWAFYCTV